MTVSYRKSISLTCPSCAAVFSDSIWSILDAQENPGEVEDMRQGRLNLVACPTCGTSTPAHTPFLFHDSAAQQVIVALPPTLEAYQGKEQSRELLLLLLERLPPAQRHAYLGQVQVVQEIAGVVHLLNKAARRSGVGKGQNGTSPAPSPPTSPASPSEQASEQASEPVPEPVPDHAERSRTYSDNDLAEAIQALLRANTIDEFRAIVGRSPFLLEQETDQTIGQLAELAFGERDYEIAESLGQARRLLQQMQRGETPVLTPPLSPSPVDNTGGMGDHLPDHPPFHAGHAGMVEQGAGDTREPDIPGDDVDDAFDPSAQLSEEQEVDEACRALLRAGTSDDLLDAMQDYPILLDTRIDTVLCQRVEQCLDDGYERLALILDHRCEQLVKLRQRVEKGMDYAETYSTV